MAQPIKRLHYFDHQFLREDDFTDEQEYHMGMTRLHNRLLHTWGIADGLEVEFETGASAVTVRSGTAVDSQGRQRSPYNQNPDRTGVPLTAWLPVIAQTQGSGAWARPA